MRSGPVIGVIARHGRVKERTVRSEEDSVRHGQATGGRMRYGIVGRIKMAVRPRYSIGNQFHPGRDHYLEPGSNIF